MTISRLAFTAIHLLFGEGQDMSRKQGMHCSHARRPPPALQVFVVLQCLCLHAVTYACDRHTAAVTIDGQSSGIANVQYNQGQCQGVRTSMCCCGCHSCEGQACSLEAPYKARSCVCCSQLPRHHAHICISVNPKSPSTNMPLQLTELSCCACRASHASRGPMGPSLSSPSGPAVSRLQGP